MPCEYYSPAEEARNEAREANRVTDKYKAALDQLTHQNDMLREVILAAADKNPDLIPKEVVDLLLKNQIEHRKEDLARLRKTFKSQGNHELLKRVESADPTKPLEPQLGFDPDAY